MTGCTKCGRKIGFADRIFLGGLCLSCKKRKTKKQEIIYNAQEIIYKRKTKKQEIIYNAQQIIRDNTYKRSEVNENYEDGVDKYHFFENDGQFTINNYGYILDEDEIINALIKNKLNLKNAIDSILEERKKEDEESVILEEMDKIKQSKERRLIREEAEKRLYGKVKTKRKNLTEEEKEMVFDKFNNECVVCGKKEGLHIHHKDENSSNNQINNLVVLCGVCHKKTHMKIR